jgi:hypothetical protein
VSPAVAALVRCSLRSLHPDETSGTATSRLRQNDGTPKIIGCCGLLASLARVFSLTYGRLTRGQVEFSAASAGVAVPSGSPRATYWIRGDTLL